MSVDVPTGTVKWFNGQNGYAPVHVGGFFAMKEAANRGGLFETGGQAKP